MRLSQPGGVFSNVYNICSIVIVGSPRDPEMMSMTRCPICDSELESQDLEMNELVPCPDCGSDLEVSSLDPVRFEEAPEEEEDWGE